MSDDTNATEPKRRGKGVRRRRNYAAELAAERQRGVMALTYLSKCNGAPVDTVGVLIALAIEALTKSDT